MDLRKHFTGLRKMSKFSSTSKYKYLRIIGTNIVLNNKPIHYLPIQIEFV